MVHRVDYPGIVLLLHYIHIRRGERTILSKTQDPLQADQKFLNNLRIFE